MLKNRRLVGSLAATVAIIALMVTFSSIMFAEAPGSGWWTSFTLQNPSNTATVSVGVIDAKIQQDGNTALDTASSGTCPILPGRSVIFNPGQTPNYKADGSGGTRIGIGPKCESGQLGAGFQGSVVISSDGPLAAVVSIGNNENGSVGVAGGKASAFYQGISVTDKSLNFPVAKNNFFNQTTTYAVQAVTDASVTVQFSNNVACKIGPLDINAGRSRTITMPTCLTGDAAYAASATSTTGNIVGTIMEHPHSESPASFALSTRAFTGQDADTVLYAPILKNSFFGGSTGLAVQNVGPGSATVVVDFTITASEPSQTACSASSSVAVVLANPGNSAIFGGSADKNLPAGFANGCFGAGKIRVTAGTGKIVATVNETSGQGKAVYSASPASGASNTVAVPLVKEDFFGGRTAVTVQAVGASTEDTAIVAKYTNSGACSAGCSVTPNNGGAGATTIKGGQANNFRRLNNFSSQYGGTLPAIGTNNSVIFTSTGLPIVAIAQESAMVAGTLDVKNYEGFKQ